MARPSLNKIITLGDFIETYRWNVSFEGLDSSVSSEELNIRCLTSGLPTREYSGYSVTVRGHETNRIGRPTLSGTIDLAFVETAQITIMRLMDEFEQLTWTSSGNDFTGTQANHSDYTFNIVLTLLNNKDEGIYSYTLYGCFIESVDRGALSEDGGEALKPSITVKYDYFISQEL